MRWPLMDAARNVISFRVRVPVLSLNTIWIWQCISIQSKRATEEAYTTKLLIEIRSLSDGVSGWLSALPWRSEARTARLQIAYRCGDGHGLILLNEISLDELDDLHRDPQGDGDEDVE